MSETLRVPRRYQAAYNHIVSLSDADFNILIEALEKCEPSADSEALTQQAKDTAPQINGDVIEEIVDAIIPLFMLMDWSGDTVEVVAQRVTDSVVGVAKDEEAETDQFIVLPERLTRILKIQQPGVATTAKATALLNEFEHVYCDARILTDIRPVFGSGISEEPNGALIVHTLRLSYHENKDYSAVQEVYVTIESSKLKKLHKVIERAILKTGPIEQRIAASGMVYLKRDKD